MNLYTIQYEVLHHTRIKTVLALTANDAYLIGKAQLEKEWGGGSYLSRSTWRSQFLDVVADVTPKTAVTTAAAMEWPDAEDPAVKPVSLEERAG